MKKRILTVTVAALLAVSLLAGCAPKASMTPTAAPSVAPSAPPAPTASAAPAPTAAPTATPAARQQVNVAMIKGPTGMGAAKLMADDEAGTTAYDYNFTVFTENTEVTAALAKGEIDIAALATNVAANFYGKTKGGIRIIAINTYGVLKILQNGGEAITSMADLAGETIYATGEGANPEYVLDFLLTENGLDPDKDVDIQWMTAEEVTQGIIGGKTTFAMLPVPAATTAQIKSEGKVQQVLDLTEEWDEVAPDSRLTMGCVVVRSAFAQENPEAVRTFLEEYEASIAHMTDGGNMALSSNLNPAKLVEQYGIVPSAAVAAKALPQANLTFVSGVKNLRDTIQGYYEVLYSANPAAIGGGIPDDAFYFE